MSAGDHSDSGTKSLENAEPAPPQPRRRGRGLSVLMGGLLTLFLILAGVVFAFRGGAWKSPEKIPELPEIPTVNLEGVDPVIAKKVRETRELVVESPRSASAWGRYAMVLQAHGFYEACHPCYDAAIKFDTKEPKWAYLQGYLYYQGPEGPAGALPYFRIAANLSSADSLYRMRLADTLLELGRFDEAQQEYRAVLAIRQDPQAQVGMGKLAIARGEYRESLPYLLSAAEQVGLQKTAYTLLVNVYDRLGDTDSADRSQKRLAEIPGDRVRANDPIQQVSELEVGLLGELRKTARLVEEHRVPELIVVVEDLVHRYPDSHEAWVALRNAFQLAGDFPQAERAARKCVQLAPKDAAGWLHLGNILIAQRRFQEALEQVQKSIDLNPQEKLTYLSLAACRKGLSDEAGVAEAYKLAGVEPPPPMELTEGGPDSKLPSALEKSVAVMTFYYADPQPAKAKQVLVDLISPENLDNPWYKDRGIVLQLLAANLGDVGFGQEELIRFYESQFAAASPGGKRIIIRALRTCGDKSTEQAVDQWLGDAANAGVKAELLALKEHLASPNRKRTRDAGFKEPIDLDYLWGDFFATGDYAPISRILDVFDLPNDAASSQLKQAAQYSAVMNIQQHPRLVELLKQNLDTRPDGSKTVVTAMLKRLAPELEKKK